MSRLTLPRIFTIGHSNTSAEEFVEKLDAFGIETLVDVRSHPGSRHVPWTNKDSLISLLGDRYVWMPELGGPTSGPYSDINNFPKHHIGKVRPEFKKVKEEDRPNTWWNQGLFDYGVWIGESNSFFGGLLYLANLPTAAICCSEALWWKCHRSMISDVWSALGGEVVHIFAPKKSASHPSGESLKSRLDRYEEPTLEAISRFKFAMDSWNSGIDKLSPSMV